MWSQWVWLKRKCPRMGSPFLRFIRSRPSSRRPVPPSQISSAGSAWISTQEVLPPYFLDWGPGAGMDPRVPQNFTNQLIGSSAPFVEDQHHRAELQVVPLVQHRGVDLHA